MIRASITPGIARTRFNRSSASMVAPTILCRRSECRGSTVGAGLGVTHFPGGPPGKCVTPRPAPTVEPLHSDRRHKMVGATMDADDLLKRVRAIPGVMEARIMHGRQCDRLYVKVASGDANPVNRRVYPLLDEYPNLGLLYEYEQAEPCGAYDAMDRAISSLTYRSPSGPKDLA